MSALSSETIIVLDFGAQYAQLIARKVRQCRVYCEILPFDTPLERILAHNPKGIIFSGGPSSVYEVEAPQCAEGLFHSGVPILGICYGHQLMTHMLGGKVTPADKREFGKTELTVEKDAPLYGGLNPRLICWMSHGDYVLEPPPGFIGTSQTVSCPVASMANVEKKLFGVQYHPEVSHTPWGIEIIRNFLYEHCGCTGKWTMENFIDTETKRIQDLVGDAKVLCALSGGVDSAVAAVLLSKAVGKQVTCLFVNHGFLRKNEAQQVCETFTKQYEDITFKYVDASEQFLKLLEGVTSPETKRIRIGNEFVAVFEEEAKNWTGKKYLAQGTLYPDVIESGTGSAAKIKTHHNVGGLPENMDFDLIEPFRTLFKDEVRMLGEELGMPSEIVWRQPFPGPGLAIRIIGEVTEERLHIVREADAILIEEVKRAGLYRQIWQCFAALLPTVRSVGVMGDQRTYAHPLVLRAVTSEDGMTSDWARIPYEVLERISNRIVNEVDGINRVIYDITSKPPATIEWE
ncbi:MAG: glutamine-hydrolyzing GMP synthase [Abditibacteriaceae bacterium]